VTSHPRACGIVAVPLLDGRDQTICIMQYLLCNEAVHRRRQKLED
jgi:hypothetical protein